MFTENPFDEIEGVPLAYILVLIGWIINYYLLIPCKAKNHLSIPFKLLLYKICNISTHRVTQIRWNILLSI